MTRLQDNNIDYHAPVGRVVPTHTHTHSLCACLDWRQKGVPGMNARSWISAYAERLGADAPTRDEFEAILALAAEAADSSERVAGPVACWVAAKAGVPLTDAVESARGIDEAAGGTDEAAAPRSSGGAPPPPRSQRRATAVRASKRRATARVRKGDTKARIFEFLAKHPGSTAGEVAKALNLDRGSVSTRLTELAKEGEIKKADRGYTTNPE
jgi:DNA-binding transcriptional ArsR family regulator